MAKSAAERQREYRERLKRAVDRTVPRGEFRTEIDIVTLRHDVDALSELFERFDSLEARIAKLEDLAERRR